MAEVWMGTDMALIDLGVEGGWGVIRCRAHKVHGLIAAEMRCFLEDNTYRPLRTWYVPDERPSCFGPCPQNTMAHLRARIIGFIGFIAVIIGLLGLMRLIGFRGASGVYGRAHRDQGLGLELSGYRILSEKIRKA